MLTFKKHFCAPRPSQIRTIRRKKLQQQLKVVIDLPEKLKGPMALRRSTRAVPHSAATTDVPATPAHGETRRKSFTTASQALREQETHAALDLVLRRAKRRKRRLGRQLIQAVRTAPIFLRRTLNRDDKGSVARVPKHRYDFAHEGEGWVRPGYRDQTKVARRSSSKGSTMKRQRGSPGKLPVQVSSSRKVQLAAARAKRHAPTASPPVTVPRRPGAAVKEQRQALMAPTPQGSQAWDVQMRHLSASRKRKHPELFSNTTWQLMRGPTSAFCLAHAKEVGAAPAPPGSHVVDNGVLVALIEELAVCRECEAVESRLEFRRYVPDSRAFIFACVVCDQREQITTAPMTQVKVGDDGKLGTRRYAKECMAAALSTST